MQSVTSVPCYQLSLSTGDNHNSAFTVVVPAKEYTKLTKENDSIFFLFFNYVIALIKNHWKDLELISQGFFANDYFIFHQDKHGNNYFARYISHFGVKEPLTTQFSTWCKFDVLLKKDTRNTVLCFAKQLKNYLKTF